MPRISPLRDDPCLLFCPGYLTEIATNTYMKTWVNPAAVNALVSQTPEHLQLQGCSKIFDINKVLIQCNHPFRFKTKCNMFIYFFLGIIVITYACEWLIWGVGKANPIYGLLLAYPVASEAHLTKCELIVMAIIVNYHSLPIEFR